MPTNPLNPSPFADTLASYSLLRSDMRRYFEFVHPSDVNEACYSHRAFELLLRASIEFEATAKKIADLLKINLPSQPNIIELAVLHDELKLADHSVGIAAWHPTRKLIAPLKDWNATPKHGLYWLREYNHVKHNRTNEFSKANLLNVVSAVAANFLLLVKVEAIYTDPGKHAHHGIPATHTEFWYPDEDFTVHIPGTTIESTKISRP